MSHKKRPRKASAAPPVVKKAVLPDQAEAALGASRYREAIEHYKELLKQERRPAWLEGLAAAYAGRAKQLAQKGMVKEALALWRTRADMCGTPLIEGPYLGWLLEAGESEQAVRLLAGATQKLSPMPRPKSRKRSRSPKSSTAPATSFGVAAKATRISGTPT